MSQDPDFTVKSFKLRYFLLALVGGWLLGYLSYIPAHPSMPVNKPCPHLRLAGVEGEFIFIPDKETADKLQALNWSTKAITNMAFVK